MQRIPPETIASIVTIDYSRDALLTDFGKEVLADRYCLPGEGPQDVFARASVAFCGGDHKLAQRLYDASSKLWFSFATPLIANGGAGRGLPISCFLNYVDDSISGLVANFAENAFLSTNGGGIGSYWGNIRSVGQKTKNGVETPGLIPFVHVIDAQILAYQQGSTRRGSAAAYIDISHPEIEEFVAMRKVSGGGDIHRKSPNLHHGICITDKFMEAVEKNLAFDLVDPKSGNTVKTVSARSLWQKILMLRLEEGEPYLFFVDTANRALPDVLKAKGLRINASNLCTEIMLPTTPERTAVCCLSSLNLAKYREYEGELESLVADILTMLDNCLEDFCEIAPPELWRAVASAKSERSVGLGTLGWHTLLQQESIPFEHEDARALNLTIWKRLKMAADVASQALGVLRGEAPDMAGTGERFAHKFAIAPNASSSIYCGTVSPSAEPWPANTFNHKTLSGSKEVRNPALVPVLDAYGKNDVATWSSIAVNKGSVQHLDFLTLWEKQVFRTALEIDQMAVIDLAADRQPYVDQAQSINLFMPPNLSGKMLHSVHFAAWKKGLKSLYYLRSESAKKTESASEKITRVVRNEAAETTSPYASDCAACEA